MTGTTHHHNALYTTPRAITNARTPTTSTDAPGSNRAVDPGVTISLDTRSLFIEGVISCVWTIAGSHPPTWREPSNSP